MGLLYKLTGGVVFIKLNHSTDSNIPKDMTDSFRHKTYLYSLDVYD